jgi:hypothetical protein
VLAGLLGDDDAGPVREAAASTPTTSQHSYLTDREKVMEELERLGLWRAPPEVEEARWPAQEEFFDDVPQSDGVDSPAPDDAA